MEDTKKKKRKILQDLLESEKAFCLSIMRNLTFWHQWNCCESAWQSMGLSPSCFPAISGLLLIYSYRKWWKVLIAMEAVHQKWFSPHPLTRVESSSHPFYKKDPWPSLYRHQPHYCAEMQNKSYILFEKGKLCTYCSVSYSQSITKFYKQKVPNVAWACWCPVRGWQPVPLRIAPTGWETG